MKIALLRTVLPVILATASALPAADMRTIYSGSRSVGANFYGGVTLGRSGAIYAVTASGGAQDGGSLISSNPDGSAFRRLHTFRKATGYHPIQAPIEGSDGRLYGTTSAGGSQNAGVIYAIELDGSDYTVLHDFIPERQGRASYSRLLEAADGRLYGTNVSGGANGDGAIFRIRRDGRNFTVLHHFLSALEGAQPYAGLAQASDGRLYGATAVGGAGGGGAIYAIGPDGTGFSVLKSLSLTDGAAIGASLLAVDGLLYGAASSGGAHGGGVIFRITTGGSFTKLHEFSTITPASRNGHKPLSGLALSLDDRLYGTTYGGGEYAKGTVFSLTKFGSDFQSLHSFAGTGGDGAQPYQSTLAIVRPGLFIGTTLLGGADDRGSIFSLAVPLSRPILIIGTKTAFTSEVKVRIRGRAIAAAGVARVEYQVNNQVFRTAKGERNWHLDAQLNGGRNVIRIRAIDTQGGISAIRKIVIQRSR